MSSTKHKNNTLKNSAPLPARLRPQSFDELEGTEELFSKHGTLRRLIETNSFHSLILWGPPGTGKTSIAQIAAHYSGCQFCPLSAVSSGVKEIRAAIHQSEQLVNQNHAGLLVFMDEIHRLNKSQQDVLLPALEEGIIKFIGATTENPSFEVNAAILSRSVVFKLNPLSEENLTNIINDALLKLGLRVDCITEDAKRVLARAASGDARQCLMLLETTLVLKKDNTQTIDKAWLYDHLPAICRRYDKAQDAHYDLASAVIKSIRASQPDAAIYYLARMLDGGEDINFISRRLVIAASEDIGNANPTALLVATACLQSVHFVGMPEARIILAQTVTYLACSPKSNRSYVAINKAWEDVKKYGSLEPPLHLRNAVTKLMKEWGYGSGYLYAHDHPVEAQKLEYLPKKIKNKRYYEPSSIGAEATLKANLAHLRQKISQDKIKDSSI